MKRCFPALLLLLFLAAAPPAPAQSDMIIKQRARDLGNANNAQEGAPPAASPGTPPPPVPAAPPLSPAEQEIKRNVKKLGTDLAAIKSGAEVSADQKQTLQNDLDTLVRGSVRPSPEALGKLVDDLSAALSAGNITPQEQGKLAKDLDVIVNSSMTTPDQAQTFVVAAGTWLKSSGVDDAGVQTVSDDLNAILVEIQKKKPKLYQ